MTTNPNPETNNDTSAEAKKPFWKRRWFIITIAVLFLIGVIGVLTEDPEPDPTAEEDTTTSETTTQEAAAEEDDTTTEEAPSEEPTTEEEAPEPEPDEPTQDEVLHAFEDWYFQPDIATSFEEEAANSVDDIPWQLFAERFDYIPNLDDTLIIRMHLDKDAFGKDIAKTAINRVSNRLSNKPGVPDEVKDNWRYIQVHNFDGQILAKGELRYDGSGNFNKGGKL